MFGIDHKRTIDQLLHRRCQLARGGEVQRLRVLCNDRGILGVQFHQLGIHRRRLGIAPARHVAACQQIAVLAVGIIAPGDRLEYRQYLLLQLCPLLFTEIPGQLLQHRIEANGI